ncbi:MAG: protein-L-isoaspartate(D-aspartate) O-methyltransferase [Acidobacteria bacterium]|nr:protein-L-isoaspartate(D-aspartate) O-methyltransferase [Acidobacteriota bacterium]
MSVSDRRGIRDLLEFERQQMVKYQLMERGIKDARIPDAFLKIPRHHFVPKHLEAKAYLDQALPIGKDQTISQPYIVALMAELAEIQTHDRVLEIGTGSGYQTAVLAELAAEIYTVEVVPELAERAEETLRSLEYANVRARLGNGIDGWEEEAPFDAIIVSAASSEIPRAFLMQLSDGGRLVIPIEDDISTDTLFLLRKTEEGFSKLRSASCRFVPCSWGTWTDRK